eukprot:CAMPEP_0196744284 /NCGR_PEP_ID=MMETSP1091-20130531/56741_1 /TAXON_ID=302021 /ORGANISM="Rhodomonas sp., Strain CCMP768" /LENGTH=242 /DNA_ID=CAMNT_0042090793 /DNA_START=99 /DNA_END=824 /DNA_ORIENTATION=+
MKALAACSVFAAVFTCYWISNVEGAVTNEVQNSLEILRLRDGLKNREQMGLGTMRLRGGRDIQCAVGAAPAWAGHNIGPKERRLLQLRSKAIPAKKVVCRWVIDCSQPVADRTLDASDLQTFLSQKIKVQAKTNNLGPTRSSQNPRVLLYSEPNHRIIVQAYVPVSKRYIKFLIKKYLEARGVRDFIWCVAKGKCTYQLRYYNFEDVQETAGAPSFADADRDGEEEDDEEEEVRQVEGGQNE